MRNFIYITSSSYSGSTLLSFLLSAHPEVATVGELASVKKMYSIYTNYPCTCGNTFENCSFWNKVNEIVSSETNGKTIKQLMASSVPNYRNIIDLLYLNKFKSTVYFKFRDYLINSIPMSRKYFNSKSKNYLLLAEIILQITDKPIFLDASKSPSRIGFLYPLLRNKLKVIFLVKDGRGVYDSIIRYQSKQPDKADISDERRILSWKSINLKIESEIARLPRENVYFLRYDRLITDTENQMKNIFDFIGINYTSNYTKFRDFEHHIIGNKMRLNEANGLYYDEKWKDSLNKHQLALFNTLAGDLNRKYGFQ